MSLCRPSGDDIGARLPIALCSEPLWCYPELGKIANDRFSSALGETKVVARRSMAVSMGEEADRHLGIIREELIEHPKRWFALGQDFRPIEGIVHFPQLLDSNTRGEVKFYRIGFALGTRIGAEAHILIEVVRSRGQHDILHS